LVSSIGSASKVSEVLAGNRGLNVAMIRNLVAGLGIPAEVLIGKPPPPGKTAWINCGLSAPGRWRRGPSARQGAAEAGAGARPGLSAGEEGLGMHVPLRGGPNEAALQHQRGNDSVGFSGLLRKSLVHSLGYRPQAAG
jgi:hypothetical protein